ncbi:MAG: cell envelope integrity protein CreD [Patescibacteria group bacterium]|jgi:inner membrane protein|nr:cell envelope integrity protein CreD [Patescibacteria group bacterium]
MSIQIKSNVFLKLIAIGFLMLLFMIPTGMIKNLINEREWRSEEAIVEVSSKWGNKQTLIGPILTVPYKKLVETEDDKLIETIKYAHFLPDTLDISGDINSEMLNRGIYDVVVYETGLAFKGEFSQPSFDELKIKPEDVIWEDALISVGIPDVRGINENIDILWNEKKLDAKPGLGVNIYLGGNTIDQFDPRKPVSMIETAVNNNGSGINAKVPLGADVFEKYKFSFAISLNGSQDLNFVPLGTETNVALTSSWQSPSFIGSFLPDERTVGEDGFTANWKILEYNRSIPQGWIGDNIQDFSSSKFGVNMFVPVDEYQKNTRSIKYAIMLIALTFLIFFFAEAMNKIKVHPIQYILVGLAIVLFFSLLLSLSEHTSFNYAYLISATITAIMITVYSKHIFKNNRLTILQGGILLIVYLFMYTIIQLEDYALLVGSIGLFVILAIVMYISRKINWYELGAKDVSREE